MILLLAPPPGAFFWGLDIDASTPPRPTTVSALPKAGGADLSPLDPSETPPSATLLQAF